MPHDETADSTGEVGSRPTLGTLFLRSWRKRCPRCGGAGVFASMFRLRETCSECDLVLRREQGAMTGQMYLSAAVTEILAGVMVLVVFFTTDWSAGVSIAVCLPLIIGFSYWFLPRAMSLWVGVEYATDRGNDEPWTRPGDPAVQKDEEPAKGSGSEENQATP